MTKLTAQAAGTFAIAPTPFHDDGRIDEKSIDRLTDFYAEVGCDGVTVLGILGEAPKLDAAEAEQVAIRFVKRARNMQVIVGVSAPGFASMRSLAKASMDAGAAGVMIAPPPHLRTDDQITGYFKQAQEAIGTDIPWVLQDYPLTLNVVFTPAVIRRIVMDSPSCVMLKHEDWPGLEKISTLRNFPSFSNRLSAEIFSRPGQSSCFSMAQDGLSVIIRRMTSGVMTTLRVNG